MLPMSPNPRGLKICQYSKPSSVKRQRKRFQDKSKLPGKQTGQRDWQRHTLHRKPGDTTCAMDLLLQTLQSC